MGSFRTYGNRSFYEENGRLFNGVDKRFEYDPSTLQVITGEKKAVEKTETIPAEKASPADFYKNQAKTQPWVKK